MQDGRLVEYAGAGSLGGIDLQYRIGSITKTFTAVLVMQCWSEGLLALEDRLGEHLPETGYADVTLWSLLAHTSGMQSEPVGPWWERSPGGDVETLLAANDGSGRVLAAGEAFHYSNLGFALLGEVVARARGRRWRDLVDERLLAPLGMDRTTYDALPGAHAQGYSVDHFAGTLTREPHHDTGAMAPAGQYWSTLADLARWVDFLATGHPEVLDAAVIDEMVVRESPVADYGLGLRLLDHRVGHTGSMPGFRATAFVDRATRRGVVGFTNATTGLSADDFARDLDGGVRPAPAATWVPTEHVPAEVAELLGLWFWGNSAQELRWSNNMLELRDLTAPDDVEAFEQVQGRWVGARGYHLAETLRVTRRDEEGRPVALECATFVYTRTPYPDGP